MLLAGLACNEVYLESISLSIQGETYSKGVYYIAKDLNKSYIIDAVINPNNFTVNDFTWKSTNTEVARVNANTFKAIGVGEATIIASYINSNGTEISDQIKINVSSESNEISFPTKNLTATYTGENLNRLFRVNEDDETGKYEYSYYSYDQKKMVANIIDAGSYKIICSSVENPNIEVSAELIVNKHKLSFTG